MAKSAREAEARLERAVMAMVDGVPQDIPSSVLGRELLDSLAAEGQRDTAKQLTMMAAALSCALKIIARSNLNTPTTEKDTTP